MLKPSSCGKGMPNHAILIVHESTHKIYKRCVRVSLDGLGVAKKYQVHLYLKTKQNLTDIDTYENIRLIQACTYDDYYKISSKGHWTMVIRHSLLT